ncbi:hypothetical protein [Pseudomonas asplenii]|uniref:Uncharacterized protein n=1 Tax=Pseudomonas asplenii TaxID=53407 RepID=A0A1H6NYR9_9PSED|nr:hypothetical protein [Pseudomonas fuscovaginae]SEI17067.1 hypothetical protein SAMN05216581_3299 [Pseudomonas fuscovaginae]
MDTQIESALRYVRNANGGATLANFLEDHEPIGQKLWDGLVAGNWVRIGPDGKIQISPSQDALSIGVEGDHLVIRIGVDCLCNITETADTWPARNEEGDPCKILDRQQFIQDLVNELGRDDEQGATSIHLAFDQAAQDVLESGSESVELPYD